MGADGRAAQGRGKAEPPIAPPASNPMPQTSQLDVNVVVENQHTVYRFVDRQTGDLVQQVPPEELLRVMRSIGELLQQSEQKFNLTI
jgi:hypothetical protein